ncbi:vWA domain-containing protein [Novipirellula sp. SH528]|uniref:vWA domain-containing protein n=1 Tax=Novipirellula sp. SH528 TaxID=3454466 RepID=UPI003FA02E26
MFNQNRIPNLLAAVAAACLLAPVAVDSAAAAQVGLDVGVSSPTILAGEKTTNYIRIALTGAEIPQAKNRPPVNVAIVIDTSGSMSGEKIKQARNAAIAAISRLQDSDIVSVILYNSSTEVLVPATKATDRESIIAKIRGIKADGNTALFAGVSKGAAEVRKFIGSDAVNRVILLSDGIANVGPKSPRELQRLGASLVKEGISVSTLGLGLGYNEDLMSKLASAGSGNHIFVEKADDLIAVFNSEFKELMSVVACDFEIVATVAPGVRPVRVLGTSADITGNTVHIPLAQLYSRQERYFVLEVEVDAGEAGQTQPLVDVSVKYQNMTSETRDKLTSSIAVRFSNVAAEVQKDRDLETYAFCAVQIANENNIRATALRDAGQVDDAKQLLNHNTKMLLQCAADCKTNNVNFVVPELEKNIEVNRIQSLNVDNNRDWARNRKAMRGYQNEVQAQQAYSVEVPKE